MVMIWWSAANALHGVVTGVNQLAVARFALGLGEGGGFPGSAKAVSEWFPAKERSFAFGLFNTGSSAGAVIAPPLIASIVLMWNWRLVFFITGAAGFVWVAFWLWLYRAPGVHPRITSEESAYLRSSVIPHSASSGLKWTALLRFPEVWTLCSAKFLGDSAWYFFIFWLPKYLADVRHLNIRQIGYYAWIPFLFAGLGSFLGGWFSSYLIKRGWSINRSRKLSLGISVTLLPTSLLISVSPIPVAIVFFSAAMFGHQFWSTIMQTLPADLFPSANVGAVSGLVGAAGSFGGMLFNLLAGWLVTTFQSYSPVFLIAGFLHPMSFLIILMAIREVKPVAVRQFVSSEA
jgi:ACS family hexuronate transporter-like MFS transporter